MNAKIFVIVFVLVFLAVVDNGWSKAAKTSKTVSKAKKVSSLNSATAKKASTTNTKSLHRKIIAQTTPDPTEPVDGAEQNYDEEPEQNQGTELEQDEPDYEYEVDTTTTTTVASKTKPRKLTTSTTEATTTPTTTTTSVYKDDKEQSTSMSNNPSTTKEATSETTTGTTTTTMSTSEATTTLPFFLRKQQEAIERLKVTTPDYKNLLGIEPQPMTDDPQQSEMYMKTWRDMMLLKKTGSIIPSSNERNQPVPLMGYPSDLGRGPIPPRIMPDRDPPSFQQRTTSQWTRTTEKPTTTTQNPVIEHLSQIRQKLDFGAIITSDGENYDFVAKYGLPQVYTLRYAPPPASDPWPMPQVYIASMELYRIDPATVSFVITNDADFVANCPMLTSIIDRYKNGLLFQTARPLNPYDAILHPGNTYMPLNNLRQGVSLNASLHAMNFFERKVLTRMKTSTAEKDPAKPWEATDFVVKTIMIQMLSSSCSNYPAVKKHESYGLRISENVITIQSDDVWGILYAFETLSQMIFVGEHDKQFLVRGATIEDWPRFKHRGVMLDSSRHFLPVSIIKRNIDAMVQNKFNVFHWHLSDDQSFPLYLSSFPDFAKLAAYSPDQIYTAKDVQEIVEYARHRGVRVMPEIDSPSHVFSWRHLPVDILTRCHGYSGGPNGDLGPLDPTNERTYEVLEKILGDVAQMFPDAAFHAGGDEVPLACWENNPEITNYRREAFQEMLAANRVATDGNFSASSFFNDKISLQEIIASYNRRLLQIFRASREDRSPDDPHPQMIMWEEAHENDPTISKKIVLHVWKNGQSTVKNLVDDGYQVLFSQCWYLNIIHYGLDWVKFYRCDPAKLQEYIMTTDEEKILGGEVCLWGEYIDETNLMSTLWPRASAAGERLWSSSKMTDVAKAGRRLEEHRCRMLKRGINAAPISGPGTCIGSTYVSSNEIWKKELSRTGADEDSRRDQREQTKSVPGMRDYSEQTGKAGSAGHWDGGASNRAPVHHDQFSGSAFAFRIVHSDGTFTQISIDTSTFYLLLTIVLLTAVIGILTRRSALKLFRPAILPFVYVRDKLLLANDKDGSNSTGGFVLTPSPRVSRASFSEKSQNVD